jgi:molecular chaperone Hsp33
MSSNSNNPKNSTDKATVKKTNRVHRFVTDDFTVRAAAVDATQVVREMQALQGAKALPSLAVGRAMVGALLMAAQQKQGHQVGVYIRCQGPLRAIYAEAHFEGQVRGYTPMSNYEPSDYQKGYQLKEAIGEGSLTVARHQPFQKAPFQGTVNLVTGEIGEDIAHYLIQSHQIRSLVSLGVYLDAYGQVRAAGGLIIEVMPGVEEELVEKILKNADTHKVAVSQMLFDGAKAEDLVKPYLQGIPFTELDHNYPVIYACPCTKDRVVRALETLGIAELEDMISKQEKADVTCQVCGRPYTVEVSELTELKNRLYKNSLN